MILGEFEFDSVYDDSEDFVTLTFTMILLVGLIIFGSLIMINLIIAFIVSDVNSLANAAKRQVLINKANHAVEVSGLVAVVYRVAHYTAGQQHREAGDRAEMRDIICLHTSCNCKGVTFLAKDLVKKIVTLRLNKKG